MRIRGEISDFIITKIALVIVLVIQAISLIIGGYSIWAVIILSAFAVIVDLVFNIWLIKLIAKDDTIRNNQKIVRIFKSTIWMLNITTLFWVFLIKKEKNNENNKTESSNNFNDQSKES